MENWSVEWDGAASGFRGRAGDLETGAYSSCGAVERAVERGEVRRRQPSPERSEGGLVYIQQSLEPVPAPPPTLARGRVVPSPATLERLLALRHQRSARAAERDAPEALPRARRWLATVGSADQLLVVDSHLARVGRCARRVRAWAQALPRDRRRVRRAGRTLALGPRFVMLTLTYAECEGWQPNHIRDFMKGMRRELGTALYAYAWVLETQKRGAPHYHVILYTKRGVRIPRPDEGLWNHGLTRIETARSPFYIAKYTGKAYQKERLPQGARMFAVAIYRDVLTPDELLEFRLSSAPGWLRPHLSAAAAQVGSEIRWSRVDGGGWVIRQTGEFLQSPWELIAIELVPD